MASPTASAVRAMKKIGDAARVVDAGLDQPAGATPSCLVVACRNSAWSCIRAVAAPPSGSNSATSASARCRRSRSADDARRAPLDRAAHAHDRHQRRRRACPAARNTSSTSIMLLRRRTIQRRWRMLIHASDPEIHHAVHDEIADAHPAAGNAKHDLGHVLCQTLRVEVGRPGTGR